MKIGVVLDDSIDRSDGVQQYGRTLGSWLQQRGHQVHYLAGQSRVAPGVHSLARNIGIKFNGNRLTIPLPAPKQKIQALLANERYDVLHVQMPYSPALAGKIVKYGHSSSAIVGTFHVLPYGKLQTIGNRLLGRFQRGSLKNFQEICFVSAAAAVFAEQNYGIHGAVIPNMIDVSAWGNGNPIVPGRVVFLGRLVPRKGCKQLLLALAALPPGDRKHLEVIIAGAGPQREVLEKLANRLKINAVFYGHVTEVEKKKLLSSAEIAVFPSLGGESFGIVLLEAMAAGAGVVIGGDNPGYRSVLGGLSNSIVDFKTTDKAAQALTVLFKDEKGRRELHKAQQLLIRTYDVHGVGLKIEAMYASAIAKQATERDNMANG